MMEDLLDDDAEGHQAIADFIVAHPPTTNTAKYLPIGAFLLYTNAEPYGIFALMTDKKEWQEAIYEGWEIKD